MRRQWRPANSAGSMVAASDGETAARPRTASARRDRRRLWRQSSFMPRRYRGFRAARRPRGPAGSDHVASGGPRGLVSGASVSPSDNPFMGEPLDDTLAALQGELAKRPEVLEAYLFGSTARGEQQPHSDIDVAVYVDRDAAPR